MKMRYIIFTAVLMCLLGVEGKGQDYFTILGGRVSRVIYGIIKPWIDDVDLFTVEI